MLTPYSPLLYRFCRREQGGRLVCVFPKFLERRRNNSVRAYTANQERCERLRRAQTDSGTQQLAQSRYAEARRVGTPPSDVRSKSRSTARSAPDLHVHAPAGESEREYACRRVRLRTAAAAAGCDRAARDRNRRLWLLFEIAAETEIAETAVFRK